MWEPSRRAVTSARRPRETRPRAPDSKRRSRARSGLPKHPAARRRHVRCCVLRSCPPKPLRPARDRPGRVAPAPRGQAGGGVHGAPPRGPRQRSPARWWRPRCGRAWSRGQPRQRSDGSQGRLLDAPRPHPVPPRCPHRPTGRKGPPYTLCSPRDNGRVPDRWGSWKLVVTLARMGDPRPDDPHATALALAAGAGDHDALAAFIRATQRDVYRFLTHLCERNEAEDLAQETYLRAMRALPSFAGRSSARTWLLAIARGVAADQIRRSSARPRTTAIEDWDAIVVQNPAHRRSGFDEGVLLRGLVAGLHAHRRDALVLTPVPGLDYAAAPGVGGRPVGPLPSPGAPARGDLIRALNA